MSIGGTFNPLTGVYTSGGANVAGSWNVIQVPPKPGVRTIELSLSDSVAQVKSIFTGQVQTQRWPGADWWNLSFSLPPLQRCDYANWLAFLADLRGSDAVFQMGDPYGTRPQGNAIGSQPIVNFSVTAGTGSGQSPNGYEAGANGVQGTALFSRGWKPNSFRLLLPGDYIQLGQRLHIVTNQCNSDAAGCAGFYVWPSIRDTLTDGQQIILNNCTGLFRLSNNMRKISIGVSRTAAIDVQAVEAR